MCGRQRTTFASNTPTKTERKPTLLSLLTLGRTKKVGRRESCNGKQHVKEGGKHASNCKTRRLLQLTNFSERKLTIYLGNNRPERNPTYLHEKWLELQTHVTLRKTLNTKYAAAYISHDSRQTSYSHRHGMTQLQGTPSLIYKCK
jgi:hypothetical protein